MRDEWMGDAGRPISGAGHFSSLEDRNKPENVALRNILNSLMCKNIKSFKRSLQEAENVGLDINKIVIQDSLNSWYHLGPYLLSRATMTQAKMFMAYAEYPGVNLLEQQAQTYSSKLVSIHKKLTEEDRPADWEPTNIQPISHIFIRSWGPYLVPINKQRDSKSEQNRREFAEQTRVFLGNLGVTWLEKDEYNNSLAHILTERAGSFYLKAIKPWLEKINISFTEKNNYNQSPLDFAELRIQRARTPVSQYWRYSDEEISQYQEVMAELGREMLQTDTIQVKSSPSGWSRRF